MARSPAGVYIAYSRAGWRGQRTCAWAVEAEAPAAVVQTVGGAVRGAAPAPNAREAAKTALAASAAGRARVIARVVGRTPAGVSRRAASARCVTAAPRADRGTCRARGPRPCW